MYEPNFHVLLIIKLYLHCKNSKIFKHLAGYGFTYVRRMVPSTVRGIFVLPRRFLHEIGWDPFRQQGRDFSRHIGWENGKTAEKFWYGRKNSNMVRKIPTWLEKKDGEGYMQAGYANLNNL
jgi:hypothetical protein